jgi:hypothetical protein
MEIMELQEKPLEQSIPKEYLEFVPLFDKIIAEKHPPNRPYDYTITLQNCFTPLFRPIYILLKQELDE